MCSACYFSRLFLKSTFSPTTSSFLPFVGAVFDKVMPWREKSRSRIDSPSSASPNGPLLTAEKRSHSVFHLPTASSNIPPSKTHWAYERGAQSAETTAKQIESDMFEVRNILANYAVEPLEMLHLGKSIERCMMLRSI